MYFDLTMDSEIFKPIKNFPDYEISCFGRVKSHRYSEAVKILKPDEGGYNRVNVRNDLITKKIQISRTVLETFVGPCPPGKQCRHLDGNKRNDCLNNLEWGTPKQNSLDRVKHENLRKNKRNQHNIIVTNKWKQTLLT